MGAAFVDIAQNCAPMVQIETLAAVVSLESKFQSFNIRINSGKPVAAQPASKAEAIEIATSLVAGRQDIQIGLGGIGVEQLQRLNLSVSDAFDPCLNLKATATLLDGYYRLAQRFGRDPEGAEMVMLQSYYGRDDPSLGEMVRYDEQVRDEAKRLSPRLKSLVLVEPNREDARKDQAKEQAAAKIGTKVTQNEEPVTWDVFRSRRLSSVLVFQNDRSEQSE
ncbi:type IV secretion system protein VirB1 [Ochrobactrum soli]|uniref:transglycosylase SLT domain-containing protein n=1 Tax=Brucella/Ochrobactrum group TaxID=2826938 RepID=UPI000EF19001|nr:MULTISPECIES: transglycosylase SLT domain-containing protein [Brucella]MCI0999289.1 transglycosylase SLT domain-containing protein [Ochrobactrum sp. C6C9]WHT45281.1 transglycosylase SLT domain-containing protein [Ochrobactrum sp. SSR]MDX4076559.1 transglycosylase SLT domain-containing protein [Brucella sp. NBRC 113783]RLL72017.1 type IV secretion system protein VirB1 [[Ochrobactrum] soli]WHS30377.1 transglycosylase SLT domain-containing protein [Brucella sp. NM4]